MNREQALEKLELLRLRAYSHAKISNSPKDMQDWIDRDAAAIRQALTPIDLSAEMRFPADYLPTTKKEQQLVRHGYNQALIDLATKYPHLFKTGEQA